VQRLPIEAVSRASADQRAGRCGRVASGVCIRLYSEEDYLARPEFTEPEIQRTNLAAVILKMAALGLGQVEAFPFVDPPDLRYIRDGYKLLLEFGAVDEQQRLTRLGRQIARLPIDPRLARMVLAARDRHCLSEVLVIVSALEVVDPRERPMDQAQAADEKHALFKDSKSDFLSYLNLWRVYREQSRHLSQNKLRKWCREHFLSFMRMREWYDLHRQLQAQVTGMGMSCSEVEADYRSIHCALLTGLLGNIAIQTENGQYLGARNLKFTLFPGSALARRKPKWLLASELVDTGRRYLRTAAYIDPDWVEPLAQHLVRRSYSEPHWEKKRAQVVAFERVTLYGLPLVQRRKVNFGPIDPVSSRQLFIHHALVRCEFQIRAAFAAHNQRLLGELDQLESKSRRRDVLVDEEQLYHFFDQRLPASIYDGPHFLRWWKKAEAKQPMLLHLDRESIMQHGAENVTKQQFPDSLEIHGLRLPVSYRFAPGEANDGLCVHVPLTVLNQLRESDFDLLVPGLLKEKITLLIKSLPKHLRRHFVPAPDFAEACMPALQAYDKSLIAALAEQLQRMTGVSVPRDAWRPELLPKHLFVSFQLLDKRGRQIDIGRDLARLQARFGESAREDFAQMSETGMERNSIQDWDFGDLPEAVELQRNGVRLCGYPALTVENGLIGLRLFDQQQQAVESHREGLLALFRRKAGRMVKEIRRNVPGLEKQTMWFSAVGSAEVLQQDLERAVLLAAFLPNDAHVRDAEGFERSLHTGKKMLVQLAATIGRSSFEALRAYHELNRLLKAPMSPQLLPAIAAVREQVEQLIYPGFISRSPTKWLPHVERYLRAAVQRLEKLPGNLERDASRAAVAGRFWHAYEQARAGSAGDERLTEFRWMIEELRVSLFAQELGTSVKVSPERLDRLWKQLK
jgi:ATP-dependent helicase HrpA